MSIIIIESTGVFLDNSWRAISVSPWEIDLLVAVSFSWVLRLNSQNSITILKKFKNSI